MTIHWIYVDIHLIDRFLKRLKACVWFHIQSDCARGLQLRQLRQHQHVNVSFPQTCWPPYPNQRLQQFFFFSLFVVFRSTNTNTQDTDMWYTSREQLEKIIQETELRNYTTHCYMKTTAHKTPHPSTHTYSVHDIYYVCGHLPYIEKKQQLK